ncbi:MAG: hydantoin utilization protein [Candidatus Rokuibacteriota bacterium]|nr:MAG: hydantoin utilization protein [Candidatus Rokubacteria bacterium]
MSYRVGIDVGGTFTDLTLFDSVSGELVVTKAPSTPHNPIEGVQAVLTKAGIPASSIGGLVHGTTIATNALLERKKATPGLITTKGFRDVVFIQRMNRKHHYDLQWDKPKPFVERRHCFEVDERINYVGQVVTPLDEARAHAVVKDLRDAGIRDIAVSFLFSYINPAHELRMREIIGEVFPEATVSLSHEVYPRWREYDRASTTLADAFLKSLVRDYLDNLAEGLSEEGMASDFLIMKSNGGVEDYRAASAKPVDLLVSGPVGGVLSAIFFGQLTGRTNLISMDMGGTSFDVSLIAAGRANQTTEFEIEWGLPVYTPMIDVKTIGAGGGSIAWIDKGGLLRVGPESAGSFPGPACYGHGGTRATVTDANLVLGRLSAAYFLGGDLSLDVDAARRALQALADPLEMELEEVAASIIELVDFNMVNAIRLVSIDRGLDPREFTLVSFGGAGSMHAAALAEIIGISEILIPIHQGVFSAFGLMTADMRVDESVTANFRSDLVERERFDTILRRLRDQALTRLSAEGYEGEPQLEAVVEMRYMGQNYSVDVPVGLAADGGTATPLEALYAAFHAEHRRLYGYDIPDEVIEFVNFKVAAVGPTENPSIRELQKNGSAQPKGERPVYFRAGGSWNATRVFERSALPNGARLVGPAVVEEPMATTLLHPGETLEVDPWGNLLLRTSVAK